MRESRLCNEGYRAPRRTIATVLCVLAAAAAGAAGTASALATGLPPPTDAPLPLPLPVPTPSPTPLPAPVPGSSLTSSARTVQSLGSTTVTLSSSGRPVIRIAPASAATNLPGVSLGLAVVRTGRAEIRRTGAPEYVLRALDVQCTGAANRVLIIVAGARHTTACRSGTHVVSPVLQMARVYTLTVQAVQMHGHAVAAGGARHVGTIRVVTVRRRAAIMAGG